MNFFNIGPMELLLILTVVLIVFGPDKIPEIGQSIGKSLRKFRQASKELSDDFNLEDLSPSTIMDALESQAAAAEKQEEEKAAPTDTESEPGSILPSAEEMTQGSSDDDTDAGGDETDAPAGEDVEEPVRFDPKPAAIDTTKTSEDAGEESDSPADPPEDESSIDYESPEDEI